MTDGYDISALYTKEVLLVSAVNKKENGLHIVFGISNMGEALLKNIKEELKTKGVDIGICVTKYQKMAIEKYISEHEDVDVLVVSEFLQSSKPYDIKDFETLNDILPSLTIIPIFSSERKNTPFINKILSLGIYNALFDEDASVSAIVDLIINGRTRKEAKYYYGAESIEEIGSTASISSCVDYISLSGEIEETKERADYVRSKISEKDFEIVISRLPKYIKDRLRMFDDYLDFFEGELNNNKDENRKSIFSNRILKSILSNQDEDEVISTVLKQGVQSAVKKVIIGFAGSQHRVGTTHQAIWFGNYLNMAGYRVAVVENDENDSKSFHTIKYTYNVKENNGCFTFKNVDYYPNYNLADLPKIFLKDYNFVLIDFGVLCQNMLIEFGRCVAQIVVCGSKPWEIPMLELLMTMISDEEVLKKINYLFIFTPEREKKEIIKNMDVLKKVYFSDYQADPFDKNGCDAIREILADYLPEEKYKRKETLVSRIKELFE